jgi:hypothetical protein
LPIEGHQDIPNIEDQRLDPHQVSFIR